MKLKTKLLTIIAPAALLTTAAPIALTSCNDGGGGGQTTNSVTYSGSKTLETTQKTLDVEFKLAKTLSTGEVISLSYPKISGSAIPSIKTQPTGTSLIVTITDLSTILPAKTTFDLKFSCYNSSSKITAVWESTITGFTFTKKAA